MSFENAIKSALKTVNKVFGSTTQYTDSNAIVTIIQAVFDNAFVEEFGLSTLKPVLRIQLSDLPSTPSEGDQVLVKTVNYTVLDSQPDNFGGATLILKKV